MVSNVYGGFANGFQATQNIAPTAGLSRRSVRPRCSCSSVLAAKALQQADGR
jgi:hypothetical protein